MIYIYSVLKNNNVLSFISQKQYTIQDKNKSFASTLNITFIPISYYRYEQ